MKKIFLAILSSLLFLSSCNNDKTSNNSTNSNFVDDTNYHLGGDEITEEAFSYKDDGTFNYIDVKNNNTSIKCAIDPMVNPSVFYPTTTIINVNEEKFLKSSAYKQGAKAILYTPDFYFSYTNATNEYYQIVASYNENKNGYIVENIINDGRAYIPLDGVVLAILKSENNPFKISNLLTFSKEIHRYNYALVNQDDIRLTFDLINEYRDGNEIVIYDPKYGNYTKTNAYGCEITIQYDFNSHNYVVKGFRGNNVENGDLKEDHLTYGSQIPKYGFVISAHNKAFNYEFYRQGRKFNLKDLVYFEGKDINQLDETTTLSKYYMDNPIVRPDNQITLFNHNGKSLDEYGYTNFNLWGAKEVAVTKINDEYGIVTAIDREVGCPTNGYILSANGEAATMLDKYCKLGTLISIANQKIYINNDFGLKEYYQLEYYKTILNEKSLLGKNKLYDYDFVNLDKNLNELINLQEEIKKLNNEIESTNDKNQIKENKIKIKQMAIDATNNYYLAYVAASESNYIQTRAAWLWATNTTNLNDVKKLIQHYVNCNVNLIYLNVFDGTTIFNSDYVPYNNSFAGNFGEYGQNNFLGAFIGEAHKANIEVHGWTTNFHVGNVGEANKLFNDHPLWQQVYYDGNVASDDEMTEQTLLYFDQANPEVQQFLINFYNELLEKNDLDGLHIDYIRYAAGNDVGHKDSVYCAVDGPKGQKLYAQNCLNRTSGYTQYAMNDFKEKYNLTGDVKELVKDYQTYLKWSEYRTNKITEFVRKLHNEVILKNDVMLSMAIVPEVEFAKSNKMQDWTLWIDENLVDTINGMYYSNNTNRTKIEYQNSLNYFRGKLYEYPGIEAASYFDLPNIYNIYFYENAMNLANMGAAIFDANAIWSPQRIIYSDSNIDLENLLKNGLHRNKAVVAHSSLDVLLTNFIANIQDKANNVYIPTKNMNQNQLDDLVNKLKSFDKNDPTILKNQLNDLANELNKYSSNEATNRLNESFELLINICNVKINNGK